MEQNTIYFHRKENCFEIQKYYQTSSSTGVKINGKLICRSASCTCLHGLTEGFSSVKRLQHLPVMRLLGGSLIVLASAGIRHRGKHLKSLPPLLPGMLVTPPSPASHPLSRGRRSQPPRWGGELWRDRQRSPAHLRLGSAGSTLQKHHSKRSASSQGSYLHLCIQLVIIIQLAMYIDINIKALLHNVLL